MITFPHNTSKKTKDKRNEGERTRKESKELFVTK